MEYVSFEYLSEGFLLDGVFSYIYEVCTVCFQLISVHQLNRLVKIARVIVSDFHYTSIVAIIMILLQYLLRCFFKYIKMVNIYF